MSIIDKCDIDDVAELLVDNEGKTDMEMILRLRNVLEERC